MTQSAPSGGGMPKWLIILLVLALLTILGCCGGFVACRWACAKAVTGARSAVDAATQRAHDELVAATQRAADEAKRQAEQGLGTMPQPGTSTPGNVSPGGNPGPANPGNTPAGGGGGATPAIGGAMPSNFPSDVPVKPGFKSNGVSYSDRAKGSGMVSLTGTGTRADAVDYYEKQMKTQGWTQSNNVELGDTSTLIFTKDARQATVQVINDNGTTLVNIIYEPKP